MARPRNAWNPSRQRKLVRLYTLTRLNKEEIQNVLRSTDFNPSSSDIQKKLRAILPPDYAKDHRKFRPSDDVNMKLRLDYLRRYKRGRISKERSARFLRKSTLHAKLSMRDSKSKPQSNTFEEFPQAFRNYATGPSLKLSQDLLDSRPVSSSMLLLDGSSLSSSHEFSLQNDTKNPASANRSASQRPTAGIDAVENDQLMQVSNTPSTLRRRSGLRSLGKQLGDSAEGVQTSVSSNSIATSVTLVTSSGWEEDNVWESNALTVVDTNHLNDPVTPTSSGLSPSEQEVWNELVDEEAWNDLIDGMSQEFPLAFRPSYSDISLMNRKCCVLDPIQPSFDITFKPCERCGFSSEHRRAVDFRRIICANVAESTFLDFYGNTFLHCAAAAIEKDEFWRISILVEQGVPVGVCNTYGETFLHVLCRKGPRCENDVAAFLTILRKLTKAKFPFTNCDYNGRTFLHNLFEYEDDFIFSVEALSQIFGIINASLQTSEVNMPVLNALDNSGVSATRLLRRLCKRRGDEKYTRDIETLISRGDQVPDHTQYRAEINARCGGYDQRAPLSSWVEDICQSNRLGHIDVQGDTPLIAAIKCWAVTKTGEMFFRDVVARMIESGAEIHARDRNGDTALTIAARRGFRATVILLLKEGSNIHSRNYRGIGILRQVMYSMRMAHGGDDLWGLRYSCYLALVDAGAIGFPTDPDEWMLPPSERLRMEATFMPLLPLKALATKPQHWSDESWPS
ncbi:ankyrin [Stipitochalara longipes BDJ]|nr:ankyrin [Stipitochalara longipes BDJ]